MKSTRIVYMQHRIGAGPIAPFITGMDPAAFDGSPHALVVEAEGELHVFPLTDEARQKLAATLAGGLEIVKTLPDQLRNNGGGPR